MPISQLFDLKGKGAIVTGAGMGIGQGIAFRLAEAGASVLVVDINPEAAAETVRQIQAKDGIAFAVQADAASVADAERVAQEAVTKFGRLDILVNNAGIFPFSPALQTTEALWDKVLDVNLKGVFFYTQAAAKRMVAAGQGGRIVNIASIDALHPTGNLVHYDASKGAVVMATKALALEFGQYGITVNAIAPGAINTPGASAGTAGVEISEEVLKSFLVRIPLGRQGVPDDIAKAALFLASEASAYITGSLLVVDGGYLLS
ncbi:MAG: SDR family oxidoreductase [Chloroflexi bacterium]|nr:SDR family oxidoreductase [Chloroflexota bacterium]